MLEEIKESHPHLYRNFRNLAEGSAESALRQIAALDRYWEHIHQGPPSMVVLPGSQLPADANVQADFDLIYAGGTLGLLHAVVMAQRYAKRVLLFDRQVAGQSTRDWNISRSELSKLQETGVFCQAEIDSVIVRSYRTGWVEFASGGERQKRLYIDNVLDCAVDADRLLGIARRKLLACSSARIADRTAFQRCFIFSDRVVVEVSDSAGALSYYSAQVLIDAMGVLSPVAMQLNKGRPHTHVCPTVGTIASGFENADYDVGEILASTAPADFSAGSGRQLIWEGFPAKEREYITYLFFYDAVDSDNDKSLLGLFDTYFRMLSDYKKPGPDFKIHRPVFGIIPAYSHEGFGRTREIASDRILLFGDAAALGSPLTFCGFGSMVRNMPRLTADLDRALAAGALTRKDLEPISAYEPNVASMANLMKYMCFDARTDTPNFVNELMNEVMIVLDGLPHRYRQAMFRDEMSLDELVTVLLKVAARYPKVLKATWDKLGVGGSVTFVKNLAGWALSSTR